jgi:hypothetical protein
MSKAILISHSSRDDKFVSDLCKAMEARGLYNWMDSHDLRGGSDLTVKIHTEIERARAFIVIISPDAFNSAWVAEETRYASQVKETRQDDYPIIALLREGIELGALKWVFSKEPVAIRIKNGPRGIEEALPHIMAALGERAAGEHDLIRPVHTEPVEELVLELKSPYIKGKDGKRRASAWAELTYIPLNPREPRVKCRRTYIFTSPLGPIEIGELRWYLERYYLWPTGIFKTRAENVEKKLPEWGQELYRAVMQEDMCDEIITAWKVIDSRAERRLSVYAEPRLGEGESRKKQEEAEEAAALLTGLPWELLHDGKSYLFPGARSIRAKLRLPGE